MIQPYCSGSYCILGCPGYFHPRPRKPRKPWVSLNQFSFCMKFSRCTAHAASSCRLRAALAAIHIRNAHGAFPCMNRPQGGISFFIIPSGIPCGTPPGISEMIPAASCFPGPQQPSIIGRQGLNHRVRYGNGCFPLPHRRRKFLSHLCLTTQQ